MEITGDVAVVEMWFGKVLRGRGERKERKKEKKSPG